LNLALVTVADLFAVMSRMEFHEADVVFDSDSAENRGPYALTTRSELPARLIEALVRPLEASAAFGRSRGSRRGIYLAMEKLASLGLVQVQPTRPKMFAALPSEIVVARIVDIVRERSDRFAAQASDLQAMFTGLRSRARGRQPFLDVALGVEGHIRRHLVPLAAARKRILSYLEAGDLMAIDTAVNGGFPILRRIAKNAAEHGVEHRVVSGCPQQSPAWLRRSHARPAVTDYGLP
jgi:hypothetical protein